MTNDNIEKKDYDIINEGLIIGALFKNPDLYIEGGSLIRSKYDFYDDNTKFLFNSFETIYKSTSEDITEDKVNMFMIKDDSRKEKYRSLGGWKFINNLTSLANVDDFDAYIDTLKKYSLVRELGRIGFPTNRLLKHPKFDNMKAEQVTMTMRTSLEKIHTLIGGGTDSVVLGSDMTSAITRWSEVPDMGIEFPFKMWTDLLKGWRKKKLIVDGMLSNEGKSRKMTYVATFVSLILGKKVLIMANEMDEDDLKSAMITTVCNNPEFGFSYNITERKITLGEYESQEEFDKVMEVAKYIEENTQIIYKDMENYSDEAIEHEMRKHVVGRGVEYIFYDTLKGHKTDGWEAVKQTTTAIRDLVKALNIGGYATIQLTDDSLYTDIFDLSSNNIANAKQLKHVVDGLFLNKKIQLDEYDKYRYIDDWGADVELERSKVYYMGKLDKNRAGAKGMVITYEVDLDLNTWKELGLAIKVRKER
jgi:replicative DNA helicase